MNLRIFCSFSIKKKLYVGWEILARTDLFHLLCCTFVQWELCECILHLHTHYRSFMYARIHTHTRTLNIRVPGATPEKLLYSIALTMKIYNDRGFSLAALSVVRTNAHWISVDRHDTTTVSLGRKYETEWCAHLVELWHQQTRMLIRVQFALSMLAIVTIVSTAGGCDKTMRARNQIDSAQLS